MTDDVLRHAARKGRIERIARGVYRVCGSPDTWHQRVLAVVWATGPDAAASHRTAATLRNLRVAHRETIEVTHPRDDGRVPVMGWRHESNFLPPSHISIVDGIPTTTVPRTLFDLTARFARWPDLARSMIRGALNDDLATIAQLHTVLAELGGRRRTGTVAFRALVDEFDDGRPLLESELEALVWGAILADGLPLPVRQAVVGGTTAPVGRVDFVYPAAKFVIEADGRRWHPNPELDYLRDALLTAAGWTILRVTWRQIRDEPRPFLDAIRTRLSLPAA